MLRDTLEPRGPDPEAPTQETRDRDSEEPGSEIQFFNIEGPSDTTGPCGVEGEPGEGCMEGCE